MAVQVIKIQSEDGTAFSPFTGKSASTAETNGANRTDESLVFAFYGNAGAYDENLLDRMAIAGIDSESTPEEIRSGVDLIFEVDAGLNGINHYGYKAP